jgi:site-specific recombinase XerD
MLKAEGGKEGLVGVGSVTAVTMDRYLRRRRSRTRWLFSCKEGTALKNSGLRALLQRRFREAGIEFRGAHGFRRGFGITFLQVGGDSNDLKTSLAGTLTRCSIATLGLPRASAV